MSKTVYHYHPATFAYLGQSEADESPLEPGVFHAPANATFDPVPLHNPATHVASYQPAFWPTGIAKEEGGAWTLSAIQGEGA